jgi:hypothetical protein
MSRSVDLGKVTGVSQRYDVTIYGNSDSPYEVAVSFVLLTDSPWEPETTADVWEMLYNLGYTTDPISAAGAFANTVLVIATGITATNPSNTPRLTLYGMSLYGVEATLNIDPDEYEFSVKSTDL